MTTFKKVAQVRNGGVFETLHWDGREGFMLEGEFRAMGQRTEVEKTLSEASRDLVVWGELDQLDDDFEVLFVDEDAMDKIMEGIEWHPLKQTR